MDLLPSSTAKTINNAQISQKPISLTGTRNYDGTTIVSSKDLTVGGFVGEETLTLSGTGSLSSTNTQSNSSLTSTAGLSLANGSNGGIANNYTLIGGQHKVTINKKPIKLSGSRKLIELTETID